MAFGYTALNWRRTRWERLLVSSVSGASLS